MEDRVTSEPDRVIVEPNPVTGTTTIRFHLRSAGDALLVITDAAGKEVTSRTIAHLTAGEHRVEWDVSALPSGPYFYRLFTSAFTTSGSIMVVR
jgi:hypothetical protein